MQQIWQPEKKELKQGNIRALLHAVSELINPVISYLNLDYQKRMESLTKRQSKKVRNQPWKTLNWEYPSKAEYECITKTLKQQKELLKQMCREEVDTSRQDLLIQLLCKIWKYIQLSNFPKMGLSPSLYHQDEWRPFVLPNKGDEKDIFQKQVETLLSFLKKEMAECNTQVLDHSRNKEESLLQEFTLSYTHQELWKNSEELKENTSYDWF